jgi:TolB-like protein
MAEAFSRAVLFLFISTCFVTPASAADRSSVTVLSSQPDEAPPGAGRGPAYKRWTTAGPLVLELTGPVVMRLRLRAVLPSRTGVLEVTAVRDAKAAMSKSLPVKNATVPTTDGVTTHADLVAQLQVPKGSHRYELTFSGDAVAVLVLAGTAPKYQPRLGFGPETALATPPPSPAPMVAEPATAPPVPTPTASEPPPNPAASIVSPAPSSSTTHPDTAAALAPAPSTPSQTSGIALSPEAPKRLLVTHLKAEGVDENTVQLVEAQLLAHLGRTPGLNVTAPDEIKAVLELQAQKQKLGCTDDSSCLAAIGAEARADLILAGTLGRVGDTFLLSLTLSEPKTSQVLGRAALTTDTAPAMADQVGGGADEVLGLRERASITPFSLSVPKDGLKVAVMPLMSQGVDVNIAKNLTQVVALELKQLKGLSVISQDEIAAMLQLEANKQMVGCDDASCFAEIGGALGVDYLVIGSVGRLADTYLVALKLIQTQRAEVANRVSETFKGREADLLLAAKFAVYSLVGVEVRDPGRLAIKTQPADAVLELDGARVDDANALSRVPPGRHALRIDADGYFSSYLETYVQPGLANTLVIELARVPEPWYKHWWVWTVGATVLAGGATTAVLLLRQDKGTQTGSLELQLQRGLSNAH